MEKVVPMSFMPSLRRAALCAALLTMMLHLSGADLAHAVPASPEETDITQPDGTKFKLRLRGDEHFSWHETAEGYAIEQDSADKFWKYARPASGQAAFSIVPGARVGQADPAKLKLRKHDLPDRAILRREVEKRRKATGSAGTQASQPTPAPAPGQASPAQSSPTEPQNPPPNQIPVAGVKTIRNIVILACFSDHWDSANGTVLSSRGRVNTTEYANLFNQPNYTTDGAVGSVRDYYQQVSYGKLTIDSVFTPWVRLPQSESYYGSDGSSRDVYWQQMITDAIAAAAAAGFNFAQGDSDSDGWVDCLTVVHSGYGQESSGVSSTAIWSKQGEIGNPVTYSGVSMKACHMEPALRSSYGTGITRIGVFCHEMGHFFGLPDLYDYSDTTDGLGYWCLMAQGSWAGYSGNSPSHMSAWAKCMLGFVKPVRIHSQASIPLQRVEDHPEVHMLQDGTANGEYFLIENRARTGFDNVSQLTPGILIYHVDSKSGNNDLSSWEHPVVKIEEADGDDSLGMQTAMSEWGDVWTYASDIMGGFQDQTGSLESNAMLYQSGEAYSRGDDPAAYTYNRLSNFSAAGATMTYSASTLKPTLANQIIMAPDYTVSWAPCSNAEQYEIQEGTSVTLTSFNDSAEDENATYDNWSLSGTAKRDSGGAHTGSYCYAMQRYYNLKWGSSVQAITMTNPFKLTASTVISYYYLSNLASGCGSMRCQISNNNGDTWRTLATYSGIVDSWTNRAHNFTALSAVGLKANDQCIIRFVADFERTYGWPTFPGYGFAVDDIQIDGTAIPSYGEWTTLGSGLMETAYPVSDRPNGSYAYRVQAMVGGEWRGFGPPGVVNVVSPVTVNFETDGTPGASLTGVTSQTTYSGASLTPVKALPPTGWHFVNWTSDGTVVSTANPLTLTNVTSDMTLVANFAVNQYTLLYQAGAHGSISGTLQQTVTHGESGSPVTAVAATGYHFTQWSDGSTTNPRTDANVTGNLALMALFAVNQYTVTFQTDGTPGCTLVGSASQLVNYGASAAPVTAVAPTGWSLVNWTQGGVVYSISNPLTVTNVSGDMTLVAHFATSQYTLAYLAGANGAISGPTPQNVAHGLNGAPVMAVPAVGYHFVQWSDGSTANPRTDTNVTAPLTVTASFAINQYALSYLAGANGSISGLTPQTVNHGATGTAVSAVAATGYHFVQWSDGSTANPRVDANVTAPLTVTASFAINQYTLTYLAGANGSISGLTPQTVNHGTSGTAVMAVAAAGYHFVQWSDGVKANPRTDANVTANVTVTATFTINKYALTYLAGTNGSISGLISQTVSHGASGSAVTAMPDEGYHFVQWSDGSTANPRTDTNVTAPLTVTASFAINQYALSYLAGANGSISGLTPQTVNHGMSGTAVTAVPAKGYHFVEWNDGLTDNPRTDGNVTANKTMTASFAIDQFTLTYLAGANGSIAGSSPQTVNYGTSGTAVTATPDEGYHFVQWSDGVKANPRADVNVTTHVTVTASFAINQYALTYLAGANGAISGPTPQTVDHGTSGTAVLATPATGYHFMQWSDGSTANPRLDANVTAPLTVTASFAIDQFTLTYLAGVNGSIGGPTPQTVDYGTSGTAVTAMPLAGHHFVQWSDGSTANPRVDANITSSLSVTASFAINQYALTYLAGDNGSISGRTPQTVTHGTSGTAVLAVPATGYHFAQWSDGVKANPRADVNVTSHVTVTAGFAINQYTITFKTDGTAGASLRGVTRQTIAHGSAGSAVTAVAPTGWRFSRWTRAAGVGYSTRNPLSVTATENLTLTAVFLKAAPNAGAGNWEKYE